MDLIHVVHHCPSVVPFHNQRAPAAPVGIGDDLPPNPLKDPATPRLTPNRLNPSSFISLYTYTYRDLPWPLFLRLSLSLLLPLPSLPTLVRPSVLPSPVVCFHPLLASTFHLPTLDVEAFPRPCNAKSHQPTIPPQVGRPPALFTDPSGDTKPPVSAQR
jgi:hypothetical protein